MHEFTVDIKLNLSFNSFSILVHSITVNIVLNLNKKRAFPINPWKPVNMY